MKPIYVEILINADIDRVWELTQDTDAHPRWDLRFSSITPTGTTHSGASRFSYELRIPGRTMAGTGISLGERRREDGTRTSALRFAPQDRVSPLGDGRGYWRYVPAPQGVRFLTGYDYRPGWGPLDRLGVRWLVGWMTAWSFDRLRIWAETGQEPERWPWWTAFTVWRADRPRASRCRRQPARGRAMDDSPQTLETLGAP
jgi:hypothetical protein